MESMYKPIQFEVNLDLLSSSEKDQLLALVSKGKGNKSGNGRTQPHSGSDYWFLTETGHPSSTTWSETAWDRGVYAFGNCFPTEEAAEFEGEKRKIELRLKDLAKESIERVRWDNLGEQKYFICYDRRYDKLEIEVDTFYQMQGTIYFPTEGSCKWAIAEVGEQTIKDYLFGEGHRGSH